MRWLLKVLGGIVVLAVLAGIGISLVPSERIAELAAREITARTGREVSFTGSVSPTFWPVLGVRTGPVSIGNASWSDSGPLLSAEALLVGVELGPLLSGDIRVREFRIDSPVLRLEKASDGRVNWALDSPADSGATATAPASSLSGLSLPEARITDGTLIYDDRAGGARTEISGLDLGFALPDAAATARLSGSARYNGETVSFDGTIDDFLTFVGGKVTAVALSGSGDFGTFSFAGRAGFDPAAAEGDFTADLSDPDAALRLAGAGATFPAELGRTAAVSARVTYTDSGLALRGGAARLGDNALAFDADLSLGVRLKLTARIDSGALAFADTGGSAASARPADRSADGWSLVAMDMSGLGAMDADVAFTATSLDLGAVKLGATKLRARLDTGRLVVDLQDVGAYGGAFAGEVVVNARKGLSMAGDLTFNNLKLQPLLIDLVDYDSLTAPADGRISFLVSGNSIDRMMKSMSGSGSLSVGQGEIIGFDLGGMLRNLDASYRGAGNKTIFSSITGTFSIKDGVLANDDMKFLSPVANATGNGTIDIGRQRLSYRVVPVAFGGKTPEEAGGISVPVLIDGTFSDINFHPDLKGLLDADLEARKKEAEEKLRGTADTAIKEGEQKLRDEVDNAIKEGVEKTLGDALKKLIIKE